MNLVMRFSSFLESKDMAPSVHLTFAPIVLSGISYGSYKWNHIRYDNSRFN